MRKIIVSFLFLNFLIFVYSGEVIKIKDIRSRFKNSSKEEVASFFLEIKNKKIEKETGYIISLKNYDVTNDIVFVEMDKPKLDNLVPDLFFVLDKKMSARLSELQMIYFDAKIKGYDLSNDMIEVSDIYLSGIMK